MLHFPGDQGISLGPSFHEGKKKSNIQFFWYKENLKVKVFIVTVNKPC